MDDNRIRLKVLGLSVGQIRQGAYALILAQADGPIRIPVVIGVPEANAIAARINHFTSQRPMLHDVVATMTRAFGIALQEVFINKYEDGVFHSELLLTDGERRVTMDSRASDAIALAMRTGSPIYTTRAIMEECGFVLDGEPDEPQGQSPHEEPTVEELQQRLTKAVAAENYEEAARLKTIIAKKKQQ